MAEIVRATGVDQVHLYLTRTAADTSATANPRVQFGVSVPSTELEYPAVDEVKVREVRQILNQIN